MAQALGRGPTGGPLDQAMALLAAAADPKATQERLQQMRAAQADADAARDAANKAEAAASRLMAEADVLREELDRREKELEKSWAALASEQAALKDRWERLDTAEQLFKAKKASLDEDVKNFTVTNKLAASEFDTRKRELDAREKDVAAREKAQADREAKLRAALS